MTSPNLPPLKGEATLDVSKFRQGIAQVQSDLRAVRDLAGQVGTIRLTADLSAGRDVQRQVRAIRDAVEESIPSDMQRRIDSMFGGFQLGSNRAQQSAAVFEAQAAALRARLNEVSNAIRLTRAEFQSGIGEATPEEVAQLTSNMRRLKAEMEGLGAEAKQTFGEWSNEALKAAMATRTAEQTAAAANNQISRLGLASQVKLGAGEALRQFGPQAGLAANGLIQLARASEQARLNSQFFEKTLEKQNVQVSEARKQVDMLSGAFNVMPSTVEATFKVLLRNGYTLQQATETMKFYAASALAAQKDVGGAYDALADDVQRGTTIMSNSYGITANQATAWQQYAKSIGVAVDKLTAQQKAEAFLVQLRREASDELSDADAILQGYAGSLGQVNMELTRAQQEFGQNIMPLLTNGTRTLVGLVEAYNAAPPAVRTLTTVLLASAVAVGILATPVASLVTLYRTLTAARAASAVAAGAEGAAETALTAATVRSNAAAALKRVLLADVGTLYAKANSMAMLYQGSLASSAATTNVFTAATTRATTALKTFVGAISIYTIAATAALALGLYWADSVKKTTEIYEQADAASQQSFERTMERVRALTKEGSELSKAKAKVLLLQQQLSDAQQGPLLGVNMLTGERIYGKPDEARIKKLQEDLVAARQNVTVLFTEAERRGRTNVVLTEDQTKAVKELRKELEGRAFELRLKGMTDLQADLARLDKEFDELREKFKKPFYVGGKLLDPAQTPALREGLAQLDTQKLAEQANLRKQYADDAAKTARDAALAAQQAEIDAMQDGAAKRHAQRQAELDEIKRETAKKVKALSDFPQRQKEIEAAAQREIAAKRKGWAQEDAQAARENQKRVQDATRAARDATIAAMADGYAKEEALRKAALDDLRADLAERVRLEQDPGVKAQLQAAGRQQALALIAQQARERADAIRQAEEQIRDVQRGSRDATLAAMQDGYAKEVALRQAALSDLRENLNRQLAQFKGTEEQRARFVQEANRQILALYGQQQAELRRIRQEATKTVTDAEDRARGAEIAAIRGETARKRAARQEELRNLQEQTRKTLETFQGTEAERQRILDAARREQRAKQQQWAQEDEQDAKERAQRIAKAWQDAQAAEFAAQAAARDQQAAQYELSVSRQLARTQDRARRGDAGAAVEAARIEAEAVQRRYQFAKAAADKQLAEDKKRLEDARDHALSNDKLSATERQAVWTKYYSDLSALESKHQADATARLRQREQDERAAAEAIRQAQIQAANQPVEQSQNRQQQLEWARDLSRSDAEILAINQQISAERAKQIQALQGQLDGVNGVRLTAEERQRVEQQIASLQHDQAVSLKEQADLAREVRQSTLDRLDAEAQLAEKLARTDAERMQAQQRQLAIRQARLRDLDDQIAGEGREKERNALIAQRFTLLGQIADLQDQINNAPFEAEQRRLDLYKAQAQAELALRGLGEDRVAQANLTVQIAARELLLANQRVAAARTELALQAALSGQASARAAFAQALAAQQQAGQQAARETEERLLEAQRARQEAIKRQLDLENNLLDAAEARAKAMLQIKGLAGDALASAEQELQVTRERLALTERQLSRTADPETRAGLLRQRLQLLGQQVEQERKLVEARAAEEELTRQLGSAEQRLATELRGGSPELEKIEAATRRVGAARGRLAQAEREYAEARAAWRNDPNQENTKALNAATNRLTEAIRNQRSELKALAEEYRSIISQMDGVRGASDRLQKAVYGEEGAPFDDKREIERLQAIASRRDAAAKDLEAALASGDKEAIQRATNDLAEQQERLRKQKELLEKNGYKVNDQSDAWVKDLAKRVDALGIQYDKEAVNLKERARIVDQEAKAFAGFSSSADRFTFSVRQFAETLESTYRQLQVATTQAKEVADAQAARQQARTSPSPTTPAAPGFKELDALAATIAPAVQPLSDAARTFAGLEATSKAIAAGWEGLKRLLQVPPHAPSPPTSTPATQPVTITHNYGPIYITQQPGESADAVANRVISKLEDRARRLGKRC